MIIDLLSDGIVSKKRTRDFIEEFANGDNWHGYDKKRANLGYAWIHYSLIRIYKPKRVLCVGSKYGYIPAICALACKDNGFGIVDFVDAGFDQNDPSQENHWGGVGYWHTQEGKDKFKNFGLNSHVNLHVMLSKQFRKKFSKRKWQYIHIDGDHSYNGVKSDFNLFLKSLDKKGVMAFHDINTKDLGGLNYGVSKFWHELLKLKKFNLFEIPGECGLGLLQNIK